MKNLKFLSLIFSFLIVVSCSDNDELNSGLEDVNAETRQELIDGFTAITPCEASNLVYFIDPQCAGSPYANAILDAVAAYNDAEVAINFTPTTVPGDAHLFFDCEDRPASACAEANSFSPNEPLNLILGDTNLDLAPATVATFPSGGTIAAELNLFINFSTCPCTTDPLDCNFTGNEPPCMFQRTVMHEMGHALGLSHNGGIPGIASTLIDGTPDVADDPNSVFNAGGITAMNCDWCIAPCAFNDNDLIALQSLYPCSCPPDDIEGPTCFEFGQVLEYCVPGNWDSYDWNIPSTFNVLNSQNEQCIALSSDDQLVATDISVTVTRGGCEYTIDLFVESGNPNFDILWNGPLCLGDIVNFNLLLLPEGQKLNAVWSSSGGLNIMAQNGKKAVAEAVSPGTAQICATATNSCGNVSTFCSSVFIKSESNCGGDGDIPNPK